MSEFIADYHETEEASLLVYNLGRLSLEWNMVEHFLSATVWELLGNYPAGMAITAGMGNLSKSDVVMRLAREQIKSKEALSAIESACKAFNILRENRNVLIHSHSIVRGENGGKPHWRRASGKNPSGHKSTEADFNDLENLIAQVCHLGKYIISLIPFLHPRRRKSWLGRVPPELPEKFEMPALLRQVPESVPTATAGRSSQEKRSSKTAKKRSSSSTKKR